MLEAACFILTSDSIENQGALNAKAPFNTLM